MNADSTLSALPKAARLKVADRSKSNGVVGSVICPKEPVGHRREDYSANGDAWNYFTRYKARSRPIAGAKRTGGHQRRALPVVLRICWLC